IAAPERDAQQRQRGGERVVELAAGAVERGHGAAAVEQQQHVTAALPGVLAGDELPLPGGGAPVDARQRVARTVATQRVGLGAGALEPRRRLAELVTVREHEQAPDAAAPA